jgi:hypothetical protein
LHLRCKRDLWEWRKWCGDGRPEAFIFTAKRNTPIRYENFLKRVLKPTAEAVGMGRATLQMLRRSFSTEALDSGASPKDVQGQMRHSQVSMSLAYGKVIAKSVAEQVDKLADELGSMIGPKSEIDSPEGKCPKDAPKAPKVYTLALDQKRGQARSQAGKTFLGEYV